MDTPATQLRPPAEPRSFGFFVDGKYVAAGAREVFENLWFDQYCCFHGFHPIATSQL